ncbi:hypothetical protein HPB47_000330, partial [Ixodes persulcatus]
LPYAPTPSSYNVDDSVHLAGVLDQALKKQVRDVSQRSEELENLFVCGLTAVECDILAYLGGFFLGSARSLLATFPKYLRKFQNLIDDYFSRELGVNTTVLPYAPTPSSYNVDDSVHLAGVLDRALKKQVRDVSQRSEELENLFVCGLTAVECDILAYLGGFFLRFSKESIGNCEVCKGVLVFRPGSYHAEVITRFLMYMDDWGVAATNGGFLSKGTVEGLRVTLESTKSLLEYLTGLGYNYFSAPRALGPPKKAVTLLPILSPSL